MYVCYSRLVLKERLNLSIGEEASHALSDLSERLKMSKTAIIEAVLIEWAKRENLKSLKAPKKGGSKR